jgi:dissimilatory sulfite reductase (desulfoviridin) alpha/beta subunit
MEWSSEAGAVMRKVPFFVKKRVRKKVEEYVAGQGRGTVTVDDVYAVKKGYMENMEKEVAGFRVENCFGPGGCPNRAGPDEDLAGRIESLLAGSDLRGFLKKTVNGPLKFHHEFTVTLADCPNACSRPQIRDIGIIGAAVPGLTDNPCSMCGQCVEICREDAVTLDENRQMPQIDASRCLDCGQCAGVCPTQTIQTIQRCYKVLLGGKLGRHPRLARPLPGCYDADQVLDIVWRCVDFYKQHSTGGKRFAQLAAENGPELMAALEDLIHYQKKG